MSAHREVELKYRLPTRKDYEVLCRGLGKPDAEKRQVNHYYRSADGRLPGADGMIRVREEGGRGSFTVKLGGSLVAGVAVSREYEEPWPWSEHGFPPPPERLWEVGHPGLDALGREAGGPFPLVRAGELVNVRKVYRLSDGLRLEVDASRYPDGETDYEVEVETDDPEGARRRLEALLNDLGVGYEPQVETKYQRFLRHLEQAG